MVCISHSICWAGPSPDYFYEKRDVNTLLPSRPRIVDPANPANNVWITGLNTYQKGEVVSEYEPGDGRSKVLRSKIDTINLK